MGFKIAEELIEKLREARKGGNTLEQIAEMYGVSMATVRRKCKGIQKLKLTANLSGQELELIKELRKQGKTLKHIAIETNTSMYIVRQVLEEASVTKKPIDSGPMRKMRQEGHTLEHISGQCGFSTTTVHKLTKDIPQPLKY